MPDAKGPFSSKQKKLTCMHAYDILYVKHVMKPKV